MRLLIILAIVLILASVVVATSGSGPRVTRITRRKVKTGEKGRN